MKLVFPKEVREEAREAINHYELEMPGLGGWFWEEVDATVRWILLNAEVPRLRAGGYRRVNLRTFPYYVAYALRGRLWCCWPSPTRHVAPNIGLTVSHDPVQGQSTTGTGKSADLPETTPAVCRPHIPNTRFRASNLHYIP